MTITRCYGCGIGLTRHDGSIPLCRCGQGESAQANWKLITRLQMLGGDGLSIKRSKQSKLALSAPMKRKL